MEKRDKFPNAFYYLTSARLISAFGTFLNMIALNILILEMTQSSFWVSLVLGTRVISGILFAPWIGYWADRGNRKKLMILSDFVLAIAVFVPLAIPDAILKYYIVALSLFIGIFSTLFEVCLKCAIPYIIENKRTLQANSILMAGTNIMMALSGLAIILTRGHIGYDAIFILNSISYVISGITLCKIKIKTEEPTGQEGSKDVPVKLTQSYAGILGIENGRLIALFIFVFFIDAVASASQNIGFPIFSKQLCSLSPMYYYGMILMWWALGNVAGVYVLNLLRHFKPENLYLIFTIVMSAGMILVFQTSYHVVIAISAFLAGVGDGTYQTYLTTYLQNVQDAWRGKVFALASLSVRVGFGIGFIAAPLVLQYCSLPATLVFFHLPVIVACLLLLLYLRRST